MDDLSCKEFVELVTDYLDERLPLAERSRFEMHLCYCPPCVTYMSQIRETVRLAGRLTEEDLPQGTKDELLRAFRGWKKARGSQ